VTQLFRGQHRDPLAGDPAALPVDRRPASGPIAMLPEPVPVFAEAVVSAGGTVEELSPATRGIIWLSDRRADELQEILEANRQVEWVQLPWAGVEPFRDVFAHYAGSARPLWTSAKGLYAEPVAEHAMALTLAMLRRLPAKTRAGSWAPVKQSLSLYGGNVVIVGAGGIAVEVIRLLAPYRVTVTVVRRSPGALAGADRTVTTSELASVLPDADVVILAAAATGETQGLIGAPELASMKPTAVLVNVARGALVDTDALVNTLAAGGIYGAGLDVTDPEPLPAGHPLWSEPLCVITSHTADTPEMTAPLLAERIRLNVRALVSGDGRFVGVVDTSAGY
jgi:phosphoglycerate dehydrogenase-like enzyme